jgi:transposase
MRSLHRMRSQLVKIRTMQAHQALGLLYEFGLTVSKGGNELLSQTAPMLTMRAAQCRLCFAQY